MKGYLGGAPFYLAVHFTAYLATHEGAGCTEL